MRRITYLCDICGEEIKDWKIKEHFEYVLPIVDENGNSSRTSGQMLCDKCVKRIDDFISDLIDKSMP